MTLRKRMIDQLRSLALFVLLPSLMFACGGGAKKKDGNGGFDQDTLSKTGEQAKSDTSKAGTETFYRVPTPGHMLSIFERYDKEPKEELLLDPGIAKNLVGSDQRAIHLGVYTTDLAYTSVFGLGQKSLSYFKTVRTLGDKLDVSSAFSKETLERIKKNIGKDSLKNISRETYMEAFNYLERNDRGETLALLVAGGWTEALYLSVNMVDKYEKGDPMIQYVADQDASFKNLRMFLKKHKKNERVAKLLDQMQGLKKAYDALEKRGGTSKMDEGKGGKMVLSGGSSLKIDKKGLKKIRKEANALRSKVVQTKNQK
ncbi:MAG: hypothetical protein ABEH38_10080 [Flavobacteriales bacterium]